MSNPFVNFLSSMADGSGDMRDYQHASRLYVNNTYELAPKAGWIYYVVLNINPAVASAMLDSKVAAQFATWQSRYKGSVGLLAKMIDLPKFTIQTETLNQYNKKTIIQKQIMYSPISVTFHDDMANSTTDMWKFYYQYYFADSINSGVTSSPLSILPKYMDSKYADSQSAYGLNNKQSVPFFTSIDVYQLHKKKFTSFKIVNPIIKEWAHDSLDQTQGNRTLTSKMTVDYETIIYNTSAANKSTEQNPGFGTDHYDNTPSPISVGGNGAVSLLGGAGVLAGADDIFGDLQNLDSMSPLDMMNTALKANSLLKNVKNLSVAGLKQEGVGVINNALAGMVSSPSSVVGLDGTVTKVPTSDRIGAGVSSAISGIAASFSPIGIKLFSGAGSFVNNTTAASQTKT